MKHKEFIVAPGERLRFKDRDPAATGTFKSEEEATEKMRNDCAELARLQDVLMATETHGVLLLFQAMDGSAKDGTIRYVMSAADPQGCRVTLFKKPSQQELRHDYLWRFWRDLPQRGEIGIFNRSYYEEVVTSRIHPERLTDQHLPPLKGNKIWKQRYEQINNFERHLSEENFRVVKFFLHISKDKQRERLLERVTDEDKHWKFSPDDLNEREHWDEYMRLYEEALTETSTKHAPWYIIPANHRWYSALAVARIVVDTLKSLKLSYPKPSKEEQQTFAEAEKQLTNER